MKKQTLAQAIKAVRAYAVKHNQTYFSVQHKWQSDYSDAKTGALSFTAYIHTFAHVDSATIEGIIEQFDKCIQAPTEPINFEEEDLPLF